MMWETIRLGEILDIKHGYPFESRYFSDSGEYILLSPGSCHETGGLKLKGDREKYFIGDIPESYILNEGEMGKCRTGDQHETPIP